MKTITCAIITRIHEISGLAQIGERIETFLAGSLALELKPSVSPRRASDGIDFLGFITRTEYVLVRKRVVANLKARLRQFEQQMPVKSCVEGHKSWQIHAPPETAFKLQQILCVYMEHFKHADSFKLMQGLFKSFPFLSILSKLVAGNTRVLSRIQPQIQTTTLVAQYNWFVRQHPDAIVLAQIGRFCELYNQSAFKAKQTLNLKLANNVRGFAAQAGFPKRGLRRAKQRLRQAGVPYIVIAEQGYLGNGLKQRIMTEKCLFPRINQAIVRV